jgi:hypothetical protein
MAQRANLWIAVTCFLVWGASSVALSLSGGLARLPAAALLSWGLIIPPTLFLIFYKRSRKFREFIVSLPLRALTLAESPRVVGGTYILWELRKGSLPPAFGMITGMTDLLFGLTAVPVAMLMMETPRQPGRGFFQWHVLSLLALFVSSVTGIFTSPLGLRSFPSSLVPVFLGPLMILIEMAALAQTRDRERAHHIPL